MYDEQSHASKTARVIRENPQGVGLGAGQVIIFQLRLKVVEPCQE